GKERRKPRHLPSLSQKRSDMSPLVFRTVNHADRRKSMGPEPSNNQVKIMKELVAELFMPIGDDFCTVENP
ncbi:hypothetical protein, partial [Fluviibacterium sp. S390]|uniref:hypothetical protein n=1 Tax=Fluviibacterium sp. S390 TaxID=3415139 RepID=UPI003C7EA8B7